MLILLPPSESKYAPRRGGPVDLGSLSYPALTAIGRQVLAGLVQLCTADPEQARATLGLSTGQASDVLRNSRLLTAPTAAAGRIYTGVLYDALGLATLSQTARRRAATRVAVSSALFGLVRLGDRIPPYRLSGSTTLPGLGKLSGAWRSALGEVVTAQASRGLVVDLRSASYASFWRPRPGSRVNLVTVRVLEHSAGVRTAVGHDNKVTKGHLVRSLLEDGANPGSARALAGTLSRLGWHVEAHPGNRRTLDLVTSRGLRRTI